MCVFGSKEADLRTETLGVFPRANRPKSHYWTEVAKVAAYSQGMGIWSEVFS